MGAFTLSSSVAVGILCSGIGNTARTYGVDVCRGIIRAPPHSVKRTGVRCVPGGVTSPPTSINQQRIRYGIRINASTESRLPHTRAEPVDLDSGRVVGILANTLNDYSVLEY